jgi:predicted DNA-binding transcriptional regulator AlpA
MKHTATDCNMRGLVEIMPVLIEGTRYFTVGEIEESLSVSRTTLWRWRKQGDIPAGHRFRKMTVFTSEEIEAIRAFANRLEPIVGNNRQQMKLFNGMR